MLLSINPTNNKTIAGYEEHSAQYVADIIDLSARMFEKYQFTSFDERTRRMQRVAEILRNKLQEYAELMTNEMGKPILQSKAEIEKCAWVAEYYAENAEKFLSDEFIKTDATESLVAFRPLGIILGVMPWNFPFWQVFRFACPTLMAGNTVILKHASNVSGCSLAIEKIFNEAGFQKGEFSSILIPGSSVRSIIAHPAIKAVSITGSTPAGRSVGEAAGYHLKKAVLELGGSDPYIILQDANIAETVQSCVTARLINGGQSCIAAKRFIVESQIYEQFISAFKTEMEKRLMGDPMDPQYHIGPQARTDLRDELHKQVTDSVALGAKIISGGYIPDLDGAWYPPTIITNVKKGMPAYDEELFGPVAAIIKAEDEADAFTIANDTVFGLGAAVFTSDSDKGKRVAKYLLNAGSCFVNTFVRSDPRLPFGGIKDSGFGRELSLYGIREFVNIKTVYVK